MRYLPVSQILIGLFALFISIFSVLNYGGISEHGAGFLPTILGVILFIFCILDGAISVIKQKNLTGRFTPLELKSLAMILTAVILFVLLVEYLGFVICATLLLFSLMVLRKPKKALSSLVYALVAAITINYVFADILMVALPSGEWLWE